MHWAKIPIEDALQTIESGKRPKGGVKDIREGVPSIGGEHLTVDGGFDFTNTRFVPFEFYSKMNKGKIDQNDVLVVKDGATTGKTAFVSDKFPFKEAVVNEHVFILRTNINVLIPRFLFYWMQSEEGQDLVRRHFRGAAQGGITTDFVREPVLPLPPLAEQRRIVARLEEHMEHVKSIRLPCIESVNQTELALKSLSSNLIEKDVRWGTVKDIVAQHKGAVRSGPFGSQLHHDEFVTSGIVAIGTRDVQVDELLLKSGWYVTFEKFKKFERYKVFPGDLLCTIVGASIGRFCAVPENFPLAFTTKHIQALTLNQKVANPAFISFMLNFNTRCRISIFNQVEGSAQPSLNAEKILAAEIPIPSIEEQCRIVKLIDNVRSQLHLLKNHCIEIDEKSSLLESAILKQAFEGKLVPQDPNDEAASVLLERLK